MQNERNRLAERFAWSTEGQGSEAGSSQLH
jgi:hypothetical protein